MDIVFIQEIWKHRFILSGKRKGSIEMREDGYGGIQTIINRSQAQFKKLEKPDFIHTQVLPMEVIMPEGRFLLINIYCPHKEKFKTEKQRVINYLINQIRFENSHYIIIAGDFNYYLQQDEVLKKYYSFIQYQHRERSQKEQIDHILLPTSQTKFITRGLVINTELSDHDLIFFNFPNSAVQQIESQWIRITKSELQKEIDWYPAFTKKEIEGKLQSVIPRRGSYYHKYIQRGMLHQASKFSTKEVINNILEEELYTTQIRRPFQIITSLLKGKQTEIVWSLDNGDGTYIIQPQEVEDKLIYHWLGIVGENLTKPDGEFGYNLMWYNNGNMHIHWIYSALDRINFSKAVGPDGISMLGFRKNLKYFYDPNSKNEYWPKGSFLLDAWRYMERRGLAGIDRDRFLNRLAYACRHLFPFGDYERLAYMIGEPAEFRMIALNKNFPNIGKVEQFRPIIVQNQIWKLAEGKFLQKIEMIKHKIRNLENFGFRKGIGCSFGTRRLIRIIQLYSKLKKNIIKRFCIINIDLSNAYDTVNRNIMKNILYEWSEKGCRINELDIEELGRMWEFAHIKTSDGVKHYTLNGLPQGSILSPSLFVIYMDEVTCQIKKNIEISLRKEKYDEEQIQEFQKLLIFSIYADDMNIIAPQKILGIVMSSVEFILKEFDLKINKKKTTITFNQMDQRTKENNEFRQNNVGIITQWKEYPIVQEFKYLGIVMNNKGKIDTHLKNLKTKVDRLSGILRNIVKELDIRKKILAWTTYIRPYFINLNIIIQTQTKANQLKMWNMFMKSLKFVLGIQKSTSLRLMHDLVNFYFTPQENQLEKIDQDIIELMQGRNNEFYNEKYAELGKNQFFKQLEQYSKRYWEEKFEKEKCQVKRNSEGIHLKPLKGWNPKFFKYQNIYTCTCTEEVYDQQGRYQGPRNLDFYHILKHLNKKYTNLRPSFSHIFFRLISKENPQTFYHIKKKKYMKRGKKKKAVIHIPLNSRHLLDMDQIDVGKDWRSFKLNWNLIQTADRKQEEKLHKYYKRKALGAVRWFLSEIESEGNYLVELVWKKKQHQNMTISKEEEEEQNFNLRLDFINKFDQEGEESQSGTPTESQDSGF